jgi:hypothetical protein
MFYVSKVFDFFDTFFIVLGKKWSQVCREGEGGRESARASAREQKSARERASEREDSYQTRVSKLHTHTHTHTHTKHNGQLSFLHVYHHLTIFMFYWINCNIGYDGDM